MPESVTVTPEGIAEKEKKSLASWYGLPTGGLNEEGSSVRLVKLLEPVLGISIVVCPCAPRAAAAITVKVVRIFFIGRMMGALSAVWRLLGSSALPGGI